MLIETVHVICLHEHVIYFFSQNFIAAKAVSNVPKIGWVVCCRSNSDDASASWPAFLSCLATASTSDAWQEVRRKLERGG